MSATLPRLITSLTDDEPRRNYRSSPRYRSAHAALESLAEIAARCRKQDLTVGNDGHSRRAAERLRQSEAIRRISEQAHRASYRRWW